MKSKVFDIIEKEKKRQDKNIELIASENFVSDNVLKAMGSCLTNKYAEGYPGKRYYGGCQYIDEIETYCQQKWQEVFNTDYHVNVQPHSGSQANMAAYMACGLYSGDCILSMSLNNGGHLTHGSSVNFSGKQYHFIYYGLDKNGYINYKQIEDYIHLHRPKVILAGASAYSREIDFQRIYNIIEKEKNWQKESLKIGEEYIHGSQYCYIEPIYKPIFMVDMSHIAGLVASGDHQSPFGYADIITTTTHKTLRGPRGGLIFCKPELAKKIDSAIFPGIQGGPLEHIIAAKAVAAEEACTNEFKEYIHQVVKNSRAMADEFIRLGYTVVTGGTDNHMFLIDFSDKNPELTGKEVQELLDSYDITVNKNCVPNEKKKPSETSGIRIGTAAMTTKNYNEEDFKYIARVIDSILKTHGLIKEDKNDRTD